MDPKFSALKTTQMRGMLEKLSEAGLDLTAEQIQTFVDIYKSPDIQFGDRQWETPEEAEERQANARKWLDELTAIQSKMPPLPPVPTEPQHFLYAGPAYLRPVDRGLIIGETASGQYIENIVSDLYSGHDNLNLEIELDLTIRLADNDPEG